MRTVIFGLFLLGGSELIEKPSLLANCLTLSHLPTISTHDREFISPEYDQMPSLNHAHKIEQSMIDAKMEPPNSTDAPVITNTMEFTKNDQNATRLTHSESKHDTEPDSTEHHESGVPSVLPDMPDIDPRDMIVYIYSVFNTQKLDDPNADLAGFQRSKILDVAEQNIDPNSNLFAMSQPNSFLTVPSNSSLHGSGSDMGSPTGLQSSSNPFDSTSIHSSNETSLPRPYWGDALLSFQTVYWPIHCVACLVICTLGIFANVTNIIVLTRPNMITPVNVLLSAMAFFDLIVNISYLPYLVHELSDSSNITSYYSFWWALYILFHAHTTVTAHTISIWLTCVLSTWRYFVVCRIQSTSGRNWSIGLAKRAIAGVVLFVPIFCIPNFLSFSILPENVNTNTTIYKVGFSNLANRSQFIRTFHFWIFSCLTKLVPCVLLTFFTTVLIRKLLSARERRLRLATFGASGGTNKTEELGITTTTTTNNNNNNNNNNNGEATKCNSTGSKQELQKLANVGPVSDNSREEQYSNQPICRDNHHRIDQAGAQSRSGSSNLGCPISQFSDGAPEAAIDDMQICRLRREVLSSVSSNESVQDEFVATPVRSPTDQDPEAGEAMARSCQMITIDHSPDDVHPNCEPIDIEGDNRKLNYGPPARILSQIIVEKATNNLNNSVVSSITAPTKMFTSRDMDRSTSNLVNMIHESPRSTSTCGALSNYRSADETAPSAADIRPKMVSSINLSDYCTVNFDKNSKTDKRSSVGNPNHSDKPNGATGGAASRRGRSTGSASIGYMQIVKIHAAKRQISHNETTTKLLVAVMIVFLICEIPAGILAALCAILDQEFFENVYQPIGMLTDLLALINSSVNFILYCFMSTQFRITFYQVVLRCPAPMAPSRSNGRNMKLNADGKFIEPNNHPLNATRHNSDRSNQHALKRTSFEK